MRRGHGVIALNPSLRLAAQETRDELIHIEQNTAGPSRRRADTMRRALALTAVVSARQDYACREDVCFYHVPKTGGDSFKYLLRDELKAHGRTFWSNEWCPRRSNGTAAMLFREPRAHVVSQYFECRDSEWALGNSAALTNAIHVIYAQTLALMIRSNN